MDFIELNSGSLRLLLCQPGTFYRGTRFDWTGVFRAVEADGASIADRWFNGDDPFRHDNVCGPSEEFSPVWIDGTHCIKTGVGILEVPEGQERYDRFKLYRITDPGHFTVEVDGIRARFTHILDNIYEYEKIISAESPSLFSIHHRLIWRSEGMETDCYNHNFFTFGRDNVDECRCIRFDSEPAGQWRADSVNGYISGCELHFEGPMPEGGKCFIIGLTLPAEAGKPYHFSFIDRKNGASPVKATMVDVHCDAPMDHAVFWSNDRVACVEPYVKIALARGKSFEWNIDYLIQTI